VNPSSSPPPWGVGAPGQRRRSEQRGAALAPPLFACTFMRSQHYICLGFTHRKYTYAKASTTYRSGLDQPKPFA
jgi:hypothetical protein